MNTLPISTVGLLAGIPQTSRVLKRGERLLEPDVYLTCIDDQPAVFKDYGRYRRTWLAPFARLLVRREARALRRLRGWAHAPMLLGIVGGLTLAMEFVPGQLLGSEGQVDDETFRRLRGAVAGLHAAGFTHNDLHPANVMVDGQRLVLLDFTAALHLPRWLRNAPVLRELRRSDLANALKIEQRLTGRAPGQLRAAAVADPGWVTAIRLGWKRFYGALRGRH
ncbi:phosphotransferase [Xanthomonas sp. XNM01]|uniref:phosphotransferase n=1 Tax=Xanthomonas sp. XNM01 TaxID=2769289 RepID=UPI00177B0A02|nr:phosphotransferase [Xanthomonas sp. XNM01]MBD9369851.1 phosphotransferase [Xanthomonas sp. XNM01]